MLWNHNRCGGPGLFVFFLCFFSFFLASPFTKARAQDAGPFVNVYTTEDAPVWQDIFKAFGEKTKIRVRYSVQDGAEILKKLAEEADVPKADVVIARSLPILWQAGDESFLQPVSSLVLESSLPPGLQGGKWFAFARQARVIVYDKTKNKTIPGGVSSYEALASPIYQGTLCLSLASLNQSLVTSLLSVHGEKKTAAWIKDLLDNTARDPIGGDEDQLKDLLAEKCSLALVGDDAVRRLPADQQAKIGILYPNTSDRGTHITIRGAGVINHAAHREEAIKLVEFLVSRTVQDRLANENKDYRAVDVLKTPNQKGVDSFPFRADSILQKELGPYTPKALHLMEKAGW